MKQKSVLKINCSSSNGLIENWSFGKAIIVMSPKKKDRFYFQLDQFKQNE